MRESRHEIPGPQRLECRGSAAARAIGRGVAVEAGRRLHGKPGVEPALDAKRRGERPERRKPLVAGMDGGLRSRHRRRIEVGGRLGGVTQRGPQGPFRTEVMAPPDLQRMGPYTPVVAVEAVVRLEGCRGGGNVLAIPHEEREAFAMVRPAVGREHGEAAVRVESQRELVRVVVVALPPARHHACLDHRQRARAPARLRRGTPR